MDSSRYVHLHQKVQPFTWALKVVNKKNRIQTICATGFCVSSDGYLMTCARTFMGLDLDNIEIKARKLDGNNSIDAKILHVKAEWDLAMLKVEVQDCQFGVLVADNALCCGQPLLCIGNNLHCVGSYMLGRVAFECGEIVSVPVEGDKDTCKNYVSDAWTFTPESRRFGDIWNSSFFQKMASLRKDKTFKSFEFEQQLHPLVPVIHCNGFLTKYGCTGGPIVNLRGEVVGILSSTADNFDIGIHVAALRKFKADVLGKTGGPSGLSESSKSADIEDGSTTEGRAPKKSRTE